MTIYSDIVSIAATTSGVSGTITVPMGAKLLGLNLAGTGTTASSIIAAIEIKWAGLATPMKFTPNIIQLTSTNGSGIGTCKTPLIDLRKLPSVTNANSVTITVTSTANQTVVVGLMWVA